MSESQPTPIETHLLIALRGGASYGYRLTQSVESQSGGQLTPDIGALYRTLARLMERGWVEQVAPPEAAGATPGRPRRYYGLTAEGERALQIEVGRMESLVDLARSGSATPEAAS